MGDTSRNEVVLFNRIVAPTIVRLCGDCLDRTDPHITCMALGDYLHAKSIPLNSLFMHIQIKPLLE